MRGRGGARFDIGGFTIFQAAEESAEITSIHFEDDGPVAAIGDGGGDVTVDESVGIQDDDTVAAPVVALFAGVVNPGSEGALPKYALSGTPLVSTAGSDAGEDDEGATTVISLAIVGGDNTDSGLSTTGSSLNILLIKEGDLIVGRVDADGGGTVDTTDDAAHDKEPVERELAEQETS